MPPLILKRFFFPPLDIEEDEHHNSKAEKRKYVIYKL